MEISVKRFGLPLLLFCSACATPRHAASWMPKHRTFEGPRWVTLVGSDDDVGVLEASLQSKGFRVARGGAKTPPEPLTRYVLEISGVCHGAWVPEYIPVTDLRVDGFEASLAERMFASEMVNDSGCPYAFLEEVAGVIDRHWARPGSGSSDEPPAHP